MTTEQNEPQAPAAPAPGTQGPPQGHRRRRRRRKGQGGSNQAKGQPNGQSPAMNGQPSPANGSTPHQKPARPSNQGQKQKNSRPPRFFQKNGNGHGNGSNPGNGPGGRRKGKQRRQQVFVGPMDHSYRVANGNMADAPPSTIELRGHVSNGNGYYQEAPPIEMVPVAVREDAPTRIFCFIDDLFFLAKIQETARKTGVKVAFVKAEKETLDRLTAPSEETKPALIIFDLNNANAKPLTVIPKIKAKLKKSVSVIGFLSHLQGDLKAKAIEAGCDTVMPRSAFSQNLPNLLRRYGLEEELEAAEA